MLSPSKSQYHHESLFSRTASNTLLHLRPLLDITITSSSSPSSAPSTPQYLKQRTPTSTMQLPTSSTFTMLSKSPSLSTTATLKNKSSSAANDTASSSNSISNSHSDTNNDGLPPQCPLMEVPTFTPSLEVADFGLG